MEDIKMSYKNEDFVEIFVTIAKWHKYHAKQAD